MEAIGAEHRWCVRHLYANFKTKHKGKALKDALWNCARATTKAKYEKEMKDLEKISGPATNWLKERDPKH